jgi:hypothetical protein
MDTAHETTHHQMKLLPKPSEKLITSELNARVEPDAHIFAFANEHGKWDFLIAKDDKLVYTSKHRVYVSGSNGETVSLGQGSILVARTGKTVAMDRGSILVDRGDNC